MSRADSRSFLRPGTVSGRREGARDFSRRVHEVVASIPAGRVATYGDVAEMAGSPGAARAVGSVLSALDDDTRVPWWRVVGSGGRITIRGSPGIDRVQRALLEDEGTEFDASGRIPRSRFVST